METAISTLRVIESVPYLSNALRVALRLLELAKEIKDSRDNVRLLAERAAGLTQAVYHQLDTGATPVDIEKTPGYIEALLETLQHIENLAERRRKKKLLHFISHHSTIKDQVTKLSKELDNACRVFQIQASIDTRQQLSHLTHTQAHLIMAADDARRVHSDLLRHAHGISSNVTTILHTVSASVTHDGTMRLFGRDELELLEDIGPESPMDESGEAPVRYRARICATGDAVTVRRFPRVDDRFRAEVETAKKIWHPNVAHAIGYSRSDPHAAFIVDGGFYTRTFNELSRTFHGLDRLMWTMKFSRQIYAGLVYLKGIRPELAWTPDEDMFSIQADNELLVCGDGRVLLDVSCYNFDRLPNTLLHNDGMVELKTRGRQLVKAFKNPLDSSAQEHRFKVLTELWRNLAQFADFSRESRLFWGDRRIPCPGQIFSIYRECVLDGLRYWDVVLGDALTPEYTEPKLDLEPSQATSWFEEGVDPAPLATVQYDVLLQSHNLPTKRGSISDLPWRRYVVSNMDYGWTLHTVTGVRDNIDCRGWFMNRAVDFCHIPEDPEDIGITYALKFHTWTSLTKVYEDSPERKPPPVLYFYERVHARAEDSLDSKLDWPWGFWSTLPNDTCNIRKYDKAQAHQTTDGTWHPVTYLGISADRKHTWMQLMEDWIFYIEVQVEVEYYKLTPDECLVLDEMRDCATDDDVEDGSFMEVDPMYDPNMTCDINLDSALSCDGPPDCTRNHRRYLVIS